MLSLFTPYFQSFPPHSRYLVAVSGGLDSAVLCHLCSEAGLRFSIAHCNFGLRGEESERDEAFVRGLGAKYGVEVLVQRFATEHEAAQSKSSIQETARRLRYTWFGELCATNGYAATVLAHHASDNMETVLMNFFRGTGLNGLTGMDDKAYVYGIVLRPLLHLSRAQIEAYAQEKGLQWAEDSSNVSDKYTRNLFRNNIIPQIRQVFPQVEANILDNIGRFKKTSLLYHQLVEELKKKLVKQIGYGEARIPVKEFMKYADTSFIYEVVKDYGFEEKQVEEIIRLSIAPSGKFVANDRYQLIRHRAWFILAPITLPGATHSIDEWKESAHFEGGKICLKKIEKDNFRIDPSPGIAQLDAKHITFPLLLRKWKQGDYFYPLGMRKKKKLARFFIDQRLPKNQKERTWVLESEGRIIWVVGHRIDDRFKITDKTTSILKLTFEHQQALH